MFFSFHINFEYVLMLVNVIENIFNIWEFSTFKGSYSFTITYYFIQF